MTDRSRYTLYVTDTTENFDVDDALARLPEQRRRHALSLRHDRDRRNAIAAYTLLRDALRDVYDIDDAPLFGYRDGGKPYIIGREDVHFNISHCRAAVACVVADRPVGVDIETVRPFNGTLARAVLSPDELQRTLSSPRPAEHFITLWTRKESYLKMTGEGIRRDLRTMRTDDAEFFTSVYGAAKYICTVCIGRTEQ